MEQAETRVVLRPLADPLPMGFLGQAIASLALSCVQLGWIAPAQEHVVAWSVLALTVPLQLLAATVCLWARDGAAATGSALLAGGWAATAVTTLTSPPGSTSPGLGVFLIALAGALLVPTVGGFSKLAAAAVVLLSALRFGATGLHHLTAASGWQTTAGWIGVVLTAVSAYAALALELAGAVGRTVLPIGRLGPVRHDAGEPGVRAAL